MGIACGVFLLFIAIVGLYGVLKHHQVSLFFYMVVLFAIFVLQFSVACASLAASVEAELEIIEKIFITTDNETTTVTDHGRKIETLLNCCGWETQNKTVVTD